MNEATTVLTRAGRTRALDLQPVPRLARHVQAASQLLALGCLREQTACRPLVSHSDKAAS
ncbi:hypothetical protein D9M68_380120 [compost metagenome]